MTLKSAKMLALLAVVAGAIACSFTTDNAGAVQTVPYKINFQGRLTDATGNIKPDGLYNMKIRLYATASGGTSLGEEVRDGGFR
ncbi:MAG: hypothetical protein EOO39_42425, partial [Cytophagaceae bacterium]